MKKVLMLLQSPFPPDIRVEREIKTLSENGYQVGIICNQYERSVGNDFPYCKIFRINALFSSIKLNKILNFPLFLNPRFIYFAFSIYLRFKPNVIHAHDLPMAPIGILLGKLFRIPVVFDVHESYPEALVFFNKKGILNFLFKNPKLAKVLEGHCLNTADKLIVVVKEHKEKLISEGINHDKICVVSNTVDLETFSFNPPNNSIIDKYKNRFIVMYTGIVSHERGLEVPIKSLKIIKTKLPSVLFMIVGEGPAVNDLQELSSKLGVENFIKFVKWPGHDSINNYMAAASVCIIPQPSNDFINSGVPNKLFEYMSQEKTILVSDAKPMSRIVREANSGGVFKSNDEKDFADKILELSQASEPFGKNGRAAVETKYNWSKDSQELVKLYKSLI